MYVLKYKAQHEMNGRNLILFSLFIVSISTVSRTIVALLRPEDISRIFQNSSVQAATYVTALATIILISNGFIMMAKERSDEQFRTVAMKDKLTGCWNRIKIEETSAQEIERLRRYGNQVSLIMIDLDHFKSINDRHGHAMGDLILKGFADIAGSCIRSTDTLGRWGGEEFVLLLSSSGFPEAIAIAERIRTTFANHEFPGGCRATASFGVALCLSTDSWEDWLARADSALYRAKEHGRNRIEVEGVELSEASSDRVSLQVLQLIWRKKFEIGNPVIDEQHKAIFEHANRIINALSDETSPINIEEIFIDFIRQMESHFSDEEEIMKNRGYHYVDKHAEIHRTLINRSYNILNLFKDKKIGVTDILHFAVYEFVSQHIITYDRDLAGLF